MKPQLIAFISIIISCLNSEAQIPDLIPYLKDGKYGYSNASGQIIIEPRFRNPVFFKGLTALVEVKEKDTLKSILINKKGEVVFWNPEHFEINLLPSGRYFTVSGIQAANSSGRSELLYNIQGKFLRSFEGSEYLTIIDVLDSVVFYYDNLGVDESGPFEYKTFDLTGRRTIPKPDKRGEYSILNDSALLVSSDKTCKLLRIEDHQFTFDKQFRDHHITENHNPFLIFCDNKKRMGIADIKGNISSGAIYKSIKTEYMSNSGKLVAKEFHCTKTDGLIDVFVISKNSLVRINGAAIHPKPPFELHFSAARSAYMLQFTNGRTTDTVFTHSVTQINDSGVCYILAALNKKEGGPNSYMLMDTLGNKILEPLIGNYCGNGIFLVKGSNGRYAFWSRGKYMTPFIYNQFVNNIQTYTLPPPVNRVVENCIVTVVFNQGNNVFGLIDTSGKQLLSPIYHYIRPVGNGLFFVSGHKGMFYCSPAGVIYGAGIE